ncbi:MAG: hypothetical protein IJZ74_11395 [Clostridia bacterium]|nr:hypothetical protein [Clostridia bacterium]
MKIIGYILMALGVISILVTIILPVLFGWSGVFAGATAILTGVVFVAAGARTCGAVRSNHNNCC